MTSKKRKRIAGLQNQKKKQEENTNELPEKLPEQDEPEIITEPAVSILDKEIKNKYDKRTKFSWSQLNAVIPHNFKQLALIGIAIIACTISTALTMKFVSEVRGDAGWITLGLGMMWELSKYTFGPIAILHAEQKMRMVLGATTVILILGSIVASLGYLTEMNEFIETNTMVDSVEYQDLKSERDIIQAQIDTLLLSASEDTRRTYRRRGLETNNKIDIERQKYIKLGEKMKKLKEVKVQLNTFDITASLIISLMLEICGILAISLFAENKEKSFN